MPTYHPAIPQRVVPGSHLDFSQELKEGWCQWCGEKTSCEGWWRQWKLSSLEFNEVLFVWKPEKNLLAFLGLSCRIPLGLKTHHGWDGYMLNSGGFVLCNPSRFRFRYTQERETQGWPPRKMGLDKNCCLFLKKSETKKKSYYAPRKMVAHQPNTTALFTLWLVVISSLATSGATYLSIQNHYFVWYLGETGCFYACVIILPCLQVKNCSVFS